MSDEPTDFIARIHDGALAALNEASDLLHANREAIPPLELARAHTSLAEAYVNLARDIRMVASFGEHPDPADEAKAKRKPGVKEFMPYWAAKAKAKADAKAAEPVPKLRPGEEL